MYNDTHNKHGFKLFSNVIFALAPTSKMIDIDLNDVKRKKKNVGKQTCNVIDRVVLRPVDVLLVVNGPIIITRI